MDLLTAAAGAAVGLAAGPALRRITIGHGVPTGVAERTCCPWCAHPLDACPVRRCPRCRVRFDGAPGPAAAAAAVLALLLGTLGTHPAVLPVAFLGVLGVALATIDLAVHRLPDRLTLPAYPATVALLVAAALVERDGAALVRSLLAGAALLGGYLVLALLRAGGLGGGDVKLAGLVGLALGWWGWPTVLWGAALGFVLSAAASLALLALRRVRRQDAVAFGPFLLGGALLAVLAAGPPG